MTPTIETCPHCGAPLATTRFAATVVCSYCEATVRVDPSVVSASKFRDAWMEWNSASNGDHGRRVSIADTHWVEQRLLARGEISDVYLAKRARWPSELAVFKIVRDAEDSPLLETEWRVLHELHAHAAANRVDLGARVPSPVVIGPLESSGGGNLACAYRWAGGFTHTFEAVRQAYPHGIPPVASVWVWRRILEVLGVMRKAGLVHGAILPNHLLIENGEHGVRLVGFSCADRANAPLRLMSTQFEGFYPNSEKLTAAADMVMSARCVSYLLGDSGVPPQLAELLRRVGEDEQHADIDPWALHKELGDLGKALFGPPAFHPIQMN
jgi:hypothetical protein